MKRLLVLLGLISIFMLMFVGCESTEDIDAPSGLTLAAATVGDDLTLTWTESTTEDIDGYTIVFNDVEIATNINSNTYTHTDITETGTYEVIAVKGDDESDPATASSEAYTGTSGNIYYISDPAADHPSGIGFGAAGMHSHYSLATENYDYIDMILDASMDLVTPDLEIDGNETWFKMTTGTTEPPLPVNDTNYGTYATTDIGDAAWIVINDGTTFGKVTTVTSSATDHYIQIEYKIQLIDNFSIVE